MNDSPRISIIVPVYNARGWLRDCLDTILSQSMKSFEVIIVDDGSDDGSDLIYSSYSDSRIRSVRTENKGVAAARNTGLDMSRGKYIGFVDSDDKIELDMFEYLYGEIVKSGADIAVCGRWVHERRVREIRKWPEKRLLNNREAMQALLENDLMSNYLWDKLFRYELFEDIRFPLGRCYEDVAVVWRLLYKAEKVICLPEQKYHYIKRSSGIESSLDLRVKLDRYWAFTERYDGLAQKYPEFKNITSDGIMISIMEVWSCVWRNRKLICEKEKALMAEMAAYAKINCRAVIKARKLGATGRFRMMLTPYDKPWAWLLSALVLRLRALRHGVIK